MTTGAFRFIYFSEICTDKGMGVIMAMMWLFEIMFAFTVSYMIVSQLQI
jgi:hypothetical protein